MYVPGIFGVPKISTRFGPAIITGVPKASEEVKPFEAEILIEVPVVLPVKIIRFEDAVALTILNESEVISEAIFDATSFGVSFVTVV